VSPSTIRRWALEVLPLLAARAPRLDRVLARLAARGQQVVLADGTLIRTRRRTGTANRPNYNGTHRRHGLNAQALTDLEGRLWWLSLVLPGATLDITAARHHRLLDRRHHAGVAVIADKGYQGWHTDLRDRPRPAWSCMTRSGSPRTRPSATIPSPTGRRPRTPS
jgi:hypothetical protein